jgi:hypothetical protein
MRLLALLAIAVVPAGGNAMAQATTNVPVSTATNTTPAPAKESDQKAWSFNASAYTYIVPDGHSYVQPSFMADRDWIHLETRYNYEAFHSGSVWVGYNFSGGDDLTWEFTPMVGGVFGNTTGIAPGYRASLSYWKVELSSEGEYVFRFGLVTQRTRLYKTDRDIQRGVLVGFSYKKVDLSAYAFNPDQDKPTFVFSVGVRF